MYLLVLNCHFKRACVDTLTLIHEIQPDIRRVNIIKIPVGKGCIKSSRHEDLEDPFRSITNGKYDSRPESRRDPFGIKLSGTFCRLVGN
jgi:hypothetical protein